MPDISMCPNKACPLAEQCYRNEASGTRPNPEWQTYAGFQWTTDDAGKPSCEYFWPLDGRRGNR